MSKTNEKSKIVLLEFNELCPALLDRWIDEGRLSNFRRFRDSSHVFVTESDEPEAPYLEPWIQWYSMHTGLPYKEHKVFHLSDGPSAGHKDIFQTMLDHGRTFVNWSSMNAARTAATGCAYLPDPWNTKDEAYPPELTDFHRYIARQIHEYTQASKSGLADSLAFCRFLATHGLRPRTVIQTLRQLAGEVVNRRSTWRRAAILDRLLSDMFCAYYRKLRPDLATFFINSTAHLQHAYWRYMEPEMFGGQPAPDDLKEYQGAILFGYQQMDRLLEDFFALEKDGATLVLATALSQQPYLKHEQSGGQRFYHPKDLPAFLRRLGLAWDELNPVMAHQYMCRFESDELRDRARSILEQVRWNGEQVFGFAESKPRSLFFANQIMVKVPSDAQLEFSVAGRREAVPYEQVFSLVEETKSGYHHPDGVLWIKSGTHRRHQEKVSILDVLPTVLGWLGFAQSSPGGGFRGKDLREVMR
jgi:hypothetical protein